MADPYRSNIIREPELPILGGLLSSIDDIPRYLERHAHVGERFNNPGSRVKLLFGYVGRRGSSLIFKFSDCYYGTYEVYDGIDREERPWQDGMISLGAVYEWAEGKDSLPSGSSYLALGNLAETDNEVKEMLMDAIDLELGRRPKWWVQKSRPPEKFVGFLYGREIQL